MSVRFGGKVTDDCRGDSPPSGGVAPSSLGPGWMRLTCPNCGQPIKAVFCRLAGIAPHAHRYPYGDGYCKLLVVVETDFAPPRIIQLTSDDTPEVVIQREVDGILARRAARRN